MPACTRILVVIGLALLMAACGFQLRGTYDLARGLSPVYIKTSEDILGRDLRTQLQLNGIATVAGKEASASQLAVDRVTRSRRVISVDAQGSAREYELSYRLSYTLDYVTDGSPGKLERSIELNRELLFDADAVLAINDEIDRLYENMQHDAARIILRQLQAVN